MKIVRSLLIVSMLVMVAFAAHSGGGREEGPVTIRFMSTEADLPGDFVAEFNRENPDINLVRVEEDWTKWMADAMAGDAPDLSRMGSGTDIAYYVNRGLLYDMTDRLRNSEVVRWDDIDVMGSSTYQYDGQVIGQGSYYGLPKDYNNVGMITYNREMFRAAGLEDLSVTDPITYEELYEMAKKLTIRDADGNVVIFGYDYAPGWVKHLVSDMANARGISIYNQDGSAMNEDPEARELWKYWARFQVEDISSNVRNPSPGWTGAAFQADRVAIVQLGYWFGAQLMENENYETKYGWAPTPILAEGYPRVASNLGATGIVMFSGTRHPEKAFRVFEWYMGGSYGIERARTGWGIPPLMSLAPLLPADNEYNRTRKAIAYDDAQFFQPWQASTYITAAMYDHAWTSNIDDLVLGSIDYDTFVDRMYAELNAALRRGREEIGAQ
ncbi:MAG: extracellular solute-binding protein [Spirochaetaceae bacterium]|nr:MAG: extracellular solute-binding protein [Spirochaetaceae bacterium]